MTTTDIRTPVDEDRIAQLLDAMTLAEKVALLAGASMWTTTPVERLGIPAMKVSDGPNGARGAGGFVGGAMTSACFPVGIALAATWNPDLVHRIGGALADEARSKGAHMLLGPTVNIHRSPLNGRNFECYSEDPYLSARMAVAYIDGLQEKNVGATVKHYVCNDSEFERNTISSDVDERTIREIYLPPFQAAVEEAHTWGVMSAYNKINGIYADEHKELLVDVLKGEWGFDGIVMSDWFGTKSTVEAANDGLDLEMPGPPSWRGERLLGAAKSGLVRPEAIDGAARRMLRVLMRAGAFEHPEPVPERAEDRPEHRALIREAAAEGIVLLKNTGDILPLQLDRIASIALTGPNAKTPVIMGGGSAQVNAHYAVTPYDGIAAVAGEQAELRYEIGCTNHKMMPRLDTRLLESGGEPGFTLDYFNGSDWSDAPVHQGRGGAEQVWLGEIAPGVEGGVWGVRMTGTFTADENGDHNFSLVSAGLSRLFVDDQMVIDNWDAQTRGDTYFGTGSTEVHAAIPMRAGQTYNLRVEYNSEGASLLAALRLGYLPPMGADSIDRAVGLAEQADVALVFVGTNGDWETEGVDRADMELPGDQATLIEEVAAANPRTVVVLQTGSPVRMPWLDKVAAVVQAWFPGQECGNAIADVLFGAVPASGKLPQTFPVRLEDNPAFLNYPGDNGHVRYGEGIFVGYRYYEKKKIAPLFPFGFGLSYTTFDYYNARASADAITPDENVTISVDITNTGQRAGMETVQCYVRDVSARVMRPHKELKAFRKVALEPGATATVSWELDRTAWAFWDDGKHAWAVEAGDFEILIGASSADIRATVPVRVSGSTLWGGPPREQVRLSIYSTVRDLAGDDRSRAVLEHHMPGFVAMAGTGMTAGMTLAQISKLAPDRLTDDMLEAVAKELEALA
jgi:beta-glucosidase